MAMVELEATCRNHKDHTDTVVVPREHWYEYVKGAYVQDAPVPHSKPSSLSACRMRTCASSAGTNSQILRRMDRNFVGGYGGEWIEADEEPEAWELEQLAIGPAR